MQETEIAILEQSFAEVAALREEAAELFYERLFVHDPSLRALFVSSDMKEQGRKLIAALSLVVGSLRKLDTVVPALEALAVKHVGYGVRDEHYATVGKALIETLSLFFANRFTLEHRGVWTLAYETIATVMIRAGNTSGVRELLRRSS
ncbi:globin family protein [Pararhizobium sp.]|uniref:globin family protein n=1 Tax=Pararhizobium sp. TaxID=1977563 RepID=UPI003D0F8E6F